MLVDVRGKISDVEKAFHVKLKTYRHPHRSARFFAPGHGTFGGRERSRCCMSADWIICAAQAALHKMPASHATPVLGSAPGGGYIGSDFKNAYVPGTSLNGSGQSVGLLQFDPAFFKATSPLTRRSPVCPTCRCRLCCSTAMAAGLVSLMTKCLWILKW